jgi:hypothetical protein
MTPSTDNIWNIQADTEGRQDFAFFVTHDEKYGVYFSDFNEYGMLKFVSPVEIWTDKQNPKLIFKSDKVQFEFQDNESLYYLDKSNILVLLTPCFRDKYYDLLYVLFDFGQKRFATINAPNFLLTELEKYFVQLDCHFRYAYDEQTKQQILKDEGKQIDLTKLAWHDIKDIDKACSFKTKTTANIGIANSGANGKTRNFRNTIRHWFGLTNEAKH